MSGRMLCPADRTAGRIRRKSLRADGGMILFVGLLAILVLSVIGVALLGLSLNENQATLSQRDGVQATYLADLAVDRAKTVLNEHLDQDPTKHDFDAELTTNDGYLFGAASGANGASPYVTFSNGGQTVGGYRLRLTNNADGGGPTDDRDKTVIAHAEGLVTLRGHSRTKRVEAVLGPSLPGAINMGCPPGGTDTLSIAGHAAIEGSRGTAYSNCNAAVGGSASISVDVKAVGTVTSSGTVGGAALEGQSPIGIPPINPADYRALATYIFKETVSPPSARIYAADGVTLVFDATGGGTWPSSNAGWKYVGTPGSGTWQYAGNATPSEVQGKSFYFEKAPGTDVGASGNVEIHGSPGSDATPWVTSIFTEGHIDVSGNPTMRANSQNLLMVAGTDISNSGNTTSTWSGGGIIAAHEQINIIGNTSLVGLVVAENAANADGFVTATSVGGNASLTYNGAPAPPPTWRLDIVVLSWRELP